jgi:hypothetical protein
MNNKLIIGIDLSFNSTGITITEFKNDKAINIGFYRLIFDDESNKIKKYVPTPIKNINQLTYKLPSNISATEIVNDNSDFYSEDQATITLKAMVACKRIVKIILEKLIKINENKVDLYINIEGFIMPSITGIQQFKSLSGLIMLQGMLRSDLIKIKLNETLNVDIFKIYITSPSDLKLWFSGNGGADKQVMLNSFINDYKGNILLPDTSSLAKINDVIDSFALMLHAVGKMYNMIEIKIKPKKKKKKKKEKTDILKNSIPIII